MNKERWEMIQAKFHELAELNVAQRDAALSCLTAENPTLADEVRDLLNADNTDFLAEPAGSLAQLADDLELSPGSTVGPYEIVRTIGEGGMGMVYLAERNDEHFQRQVALKVIKRGMDTHRVIRRFRAERQILASLTHPNIAHLYDGGMSDDGVPYFAMEFIDGLPIDEHCTQNNISLAERLDLMRDVCSAVHHAHQKLIVHRDLKPSNVMVASDGTVKLLDFGIATLLDDRPHDDEPNTMTGMRPLTPDFASPEQIRGEPLTTAADVYALGVLLHVLLTGHRPHCLTTVPPHELATAVASLPRPQPSSSNISWAKRLRGDLDTIVQAAMHTEPERRYRSAAALADDILDHLKGRPISARADSFRYRTVKFVRRNRLGVSLTAAVFLVTVVFALATGRQAMLIQRQSEQIALERDRAEDVTSVLVSMFDISDPIQGRVVRGDTLRVLDFLKLNETRLMTELEDQPELKASVSLMMSRLYGNLGLFDQSEGLIRESVQLRRSILPSSHPDLAQSIDYLGTVLHNLGQFDAAESTFREALEMRSDLFDPPHVDLAESMNNLSWALSSQGKDDEAILLDIDALAMRRAVLGNNDPEVAQSLNNLAGSMYYLDRLDEAEPLWREALALRRNLLGNEHPYVANTLNNLGRLLNDKENYAQANSMITEALSIWSRTLGPRHPRLAAGYFNLALTAEGLHNLPGAVEAMQNSLDIDAANLPADHPYVAQGSENLGRLLLAADRREEGRQLLDRALVIYEVIDGPTGDDAVRTKALIARAEKTSTHD